MKLLVASACAALLFVSAAHAQFTQINLSGQTNANIQGYTAGGNYPLGGTTLTIGGVPFTLAGVGATDVVQSSGFNVFNFSVPSGTQATALYTLMNTAWGIAGQFQGSVTVTGTLGETATLNLVEGVNIRDHFNGVFVNTLTDATVIQTDFIGGLVNPAGPVRLDRQQLLLPGTFAGDTIASVTFSTPNAGFPQGAPFLAAATLVDAPSSVPDSAPVGYLLVIGGLVLAVARRQSFATRA